ncbi:hypothetical protein L2E82_37731 [Cichorium intybus]|uniref:Uncharacterized protein n=1 Tax=Cichorium intybus TaxID=13427 RepID=A0ACB9AEG2_CICIN|nr:hypothetical protein L2E82_37731 [Cichorium intybus]
MNDQHVFKKGIFVIKHCISHEINTQEEDPGALNRSSTSGDGQPRNSGGSRTRTSSCTKEEVNVIPIQCGRLVQSNFVGSQIPKSRKRYSRSKRNLDFDLDISLKNDDSNDETTESDEALDHHYRHREEVRVSSLSRM